jgi:hypothetical protein
MPSTLDPKLDSALNWFGTKAQLVAAFPTPSFPHGTYAPTTDQGPQYWHSGLQQWLGENQTGNFGLQASSFFRWKPVGPRTTTFTATVAIGDTTKTLTGNWAGPTGLFQMTLSSGEVVNAFLTNGATTCSFFPFPNPPNVGHYGGAYAATKTATITATVAGVPPLLGVANAYSVSASIGTGGNAVLGGAQCVAGVGVPDVPRNVVGAWTTSSTVTVTGTDYYGKAQTEAQTGTTFTGKKAFATITQIQSSAAVTGATFGTGAVLGLPFRVTSGDVFGPVLNNAADAGTVVVGDITVPATSTTGDVRGTYAPAGALNGTSYLAANMIISDNVSQIGTLGVTPV